MIYPDLIHCLEEYSGRRDGAVVRELPCPHCDPCSIPGPGIICEWSLLLVFSGYSGFPLPSFQFDPGMHGHLWTSSCELLGAQITLLLPYFYFFRSWHHIWHKEAKHFLQDAVLKATINNWLYKCILVNWVLSTGLIIWIRHRNEIRKLTFRALALRRSEFAPTKG